MASSLPKMRKNSASFSQSIRNRLRLKKHQAQAKNFCRVLDIRVPKIREVKKDNLKQTMVFMVTLEVMVLILQFVTTVILQSAFFGVLSFIPFVAVIGGFEYAYRKRENEANETTRGFRKKFYKISAWLGMYFPVRFIMSALVRLYPRPYNSLVFDCLIVAVYLIAAALITLLIERYYRKKR